MTGEHSQEPSKDFDPSDPASFVPSAGVKLAAVTYAVAGALLAITGLQVVTSVRFFDPIHAVAPWAMVVLGPPLVAIGAKVYRLHASAAKAGIAVASLSFLVAAGFGVFAFANALFSCASLLAIPASFAAIGLGVLAYGPCVRATTARERLRDEGIELGF